MEAAVRSVLLEYLRSQDIKCVEDILGTWLCDVQLLWAALNLIESDSRNRDLSLLECGVVGMWFRHNSENLTLEVVNEVILKLGRLLLSEHLAHSKLCDLYRLFALKYLYDSSWPNLLHALVSIPCTSFHLFEVGTMLSSLFRLFGREWLSQHSQVLEAFWGAFLAPVLSFNFEKGSSACISALQIYRDLFLEGMFESERILNFIYACLESSNDLSLWKLSLEIIDHLEKTARIITLLEKAVQIRLVSSCFRRLMSIVLRLGCDQTELLLSGMLYCIALGPNELQDFIESPELYYQCVYNHFGGPVEKHPRFWYRRVIQSNPSYGHLLLDIPPCEESIWLIGAFKGVREAEHYLVQCIKQRLDLPAVATLLYSLSSISNSSDDVLQFAFNSISTGHPVVITNAIRLLRKFVTRSQIELSCTILDIMVSNVDKCLTKDALQILSEVISSSPAQFQPLSGVFLAMLASVSDSETLGIAIDCVDALIPVMNESQLQTVVVRVVEILADCDGSLFLDSIVSVLLHCLQISKEFSVASFTYLSSQIRDMHASTICDLSEVFLFAMFAFGDAVPTESVSAVVSAFSMVIANDTSSSEEKCLACMVIVSALLKHREIDAAFTFDLLGCGATGRVRSFIYCQLGLTLIITGKEAAIDKELLFGYLRDNVHNEMTCMLLDMLGYPRCNQSDWIPIPDSVLPFLVVVK